MILEGKRLVIAEYAFDGRRTVAGGDTGHVKVGTRHVLDVRYQGGRVWARAWRADGPDLGTQAQLGQPHQPLCLAGPRQHVVDRPGRSRSALAAGSA